MVSKLTTRQVIIKTELMTYKTKLKNLRFPTNQLRPIWTIKTINGTNSGVNMWHRWRALLIKLMLIETLKPLERSWNKSKPWKQKHMLSKVKFLKLKSWSYQQSMMKNLTNSSKEFKPRLANTRFYWTINQLFSKKCMPTPSWWSTEINKLFKIKKKLFN